MSAIRQHAYYRATVRIRHGTDLALKPHCDHLEGRHSVFMAAWRMQADDHRYPGEWAMVPIDARDDWPIAWIASGDLVNIIEHPGKEPIP